VKEYPYPALRPAPFANGNLDLEFDPDGHIWIALMNQTGIARFDRKAESFELHPIPESMRDDETQQGMVAPVHSNVDGKIWVQAVSKPMITRFDKQTKQYEPWRFPFSASPGFHIAYGVYTDAANNAYLCGFANDYIWRIDAKSGDVQAFQVPTRMSKPRRGRMTPDDKLVFAEWWADKVGLFDTRTNEFREWTVPGYFPAPYDAEMDREGWIWTDNTMDDRVTRIDTRTGLTIQYLLPIGTNARRISVDHFGARPAVWIGSNHEAVVMKVEPLD
jgi:streptogramin lyase